VKEFGNEGRHPPLGTAAATREAPPIDIADYLLKKSFDKKYKIDSLAQLTVIQ